MPNSKSLVNVLGCQHQNFLDFIERCLDWDPQTRITPFEALMHDWVIEGLPPKVLLHHQRMLGIDVTENGESDTFDSMNSAGKMMEVVPAPVTRK